MKRDVTGQRFGMLVAIRPIGKTGDHTRWECQCDCGRTKGVLINNLGRSTFSCGCKRTKTLADSQRTHGKTETPEHKAWAGAIERCTNPNYWRFDRYGGRGITICARWRNSFENFLADMGPRPSPTHSLDRINNDGNYEPGNCRWATRTEQGSNRTGVIHVTAWGKTLSVKQWVAETGLHRRTIIDRIFKHGMAPEDALSKAGRPQNARR